VYFFVFLAHPNPSSEELRAMNQHAFASRQRTPAPLAVRWAAGLLAAYGLMVLVHLLILSPSVNGIAPSLMRTSIRRFLGAAVMVWGVTRGLSWGRWLTLALGGLWAVFSGLALIEYAGSPTVASMQTLYFGPAGVMAFLLLGGAIGCLLLPQSRAWFRRRTV
jgi:hypothetical protein